MELWNFLWTQNGTKTIGFFSGTVSVISGTTGIIPDHQLKYWLLASGLLTFYRGFFNSSSNGDKP